MKLRPSQKMKSKRALLVLILLVSGLVFSSQGLLMKLMRPVASPLVAAGTWLSDSMFWWQKANAITPEALEALYEQRTQLAVEKVDFEKLKQENEQLQQELSFIRRTHYEAVAARVLAKSVSNSVSRFVIDIGSEQGVSEGEAVVSGDGIFIGKVTKLGVHSSTVTALSDPEHSVAVGLLNESRTIGVAKGTIGDLLEIDFIPIDEQISKYALVVTSGLETPIPSGLFVGIVNTVQQEIGSPFQQAIVEPLGDIRRLSTVLVLTATPFSP